MPTENEIEQIRNLASNGKSVNHIKEKMELPKSTVYYHFKKEVGQKQKENALKIPKDEEVKGEICGVFAGDVNYYKDENYKYRIKFTLNINEAYWEELAGFLEESLEKEPRVNHQRKYNRMNLRYESKELLNFLKANLKWEKSDKTESIQLRQREYSREFKLGFLRGLLDTDGFVSTTRRRVTFNSISKNLTQNISGILGEFQIEHKFDRDTDNRENCRDMYRARITGSKCSELITEIEPRHPKKQLERLNSKSKTY